MSAASHAHDDHADHAHGAHGKDHVPHVLPLGVYLGTFATLLVLTAITVGASYVNFGAWNLIIAMVIATVKAATVALIFMHLWFDHKFHSVIIGSSVLFLAIFITFTMFDTENRGRAEAIEGEKPADISNPFKASERQAAMMKNMGPISSATAEMAKPFPPAAAPSASTPAAASASAEPAPSASAAPSTSASAAPSGSTSAAPAVSASAVPPVASGSAKKP
jgi:cytochrome c oxidase subunit 4